MLTSPSNILPLHLKQTFRPIILIFTEGEGDRIESRLPFKNINTRNYFQFYSLSSGRGLFVSHLKDLFVWINESEHFKLGVVQKDGNLKSVFQRLMLNVENIWNYFKWVQDEDNLGKVSICFTNCFHDFFMFE